MTNTTAIELAPPVRILEFNQLAKDSSRANPVESLVEKLGVVYVTSITRDGCSGCAEQKPLFKELAAKTALTHKGTVSFSNIHVHYSEDNMKESPEAKKLLRHGAYPTYTIHVKSRFGPLEAYRAIYPSMEELEKQVNEAISLAEYYKEDAEKNSARDK